MNKPLIVDARGMRCPWPALKLAKAMRGPPRPPEATLLADDPAAAREVAAMAAEHGWTLTSDEEGVFHISCRP